MHYPYGFRATSKGDSIRGSYSHLHPRSVMDYLAAFGTKGVKADGIQLTGVPAGMRIGSIGNTGRSSGPHLDLITKIPNSSKPAWESKDPMLIYPALTEYDDEWDWSKVYAGHQDNMVTTEMLKNFYNYNGGDMYPLLPAMNKEFMTSEAVDWGIKRFALDNNITW